MMTISTITIDMDRPCRRCREVTGTAENGLCLACIAKEVTSMGNGQQLSLDVELVDLTDDERMERGVRLANLCREEVLMAQEHADRRKAMKEDREKLEEEIAALSDVVRSGQEERPKGVSR